EGKHKPKCLCHPCRNPLRLAQSVLAVFPTPTSHLCASRWRPQPHLPATLAVQYHMLNRDRDGVVGTVASLTSPKPGQSRATSAVDLHCSLGRGSTLADAKEYGVKHGHDDHGQDAGKGQSKHDGRCHRYEKRILKEWNHPEHRGHGD